MSRIGIMGGTFNPVHNGHINLAQSALKELNLDKIWFMPSKNPPHKTKNKIASEEHRVAMLRLAIESYKDFELSLMEFEREGITYSADTLEELKKKHVEDDFYFIIGADSLINIEKWHRPDKLFKFTTFVVACRDDVDKDDLQSHIVYLKDKYDEVSIEILDMDRIDVSSTEIRKICIEMSLSKEEYLKDGMPQESYSEVGYIQINPKVYEYILSNKVYI